MPVKPIENGYIVSVYHHRKRYQERVLSPHSETFRKRLEEECILISFIMRTEDQELASRLPNSKILKRFFAAKTPQFTIDDYATLWFKRNQVNWSKSTEIGYRKKYNGKLASAFGKMQITKFKNTDFSDWASTQSLSGKTLNEYRLILTLIFKEAFFDGVVATNVMDRVRRFKQTRKEPDPFTPTEIEKVLKALPSPYNWYYTLAFYTGCRPGELIALRRQDVDIKNNRIFIRVNFVAGKETQPKTAASLRTIPLLPAPALALEQLFASEFTSDYRCFINPNTGAEFTADGLRRHVWEPTLKQLKIRYRPQYQCRHTFASMMLTKGMDPSKLARVMGHSDWGMIRHVYARWIDEFNPSSEI